MNRRVDLCDLTGQLSSLVNLTEPVVGGGAVVLGILVGVHPQLHFIKV